MNTQMSELREKEIFVELLRRPDKGAISDNVDVSVVVRYGVSLETVENIRRKGMARNWPPLD